jgi:hypothetical protein
LTPPLSQDSASTLHLDRRLLPDLPHASPLDLSPFLTHVQPLKVLPNLAVSTPAVGKPPGNRESLGHSVHVHIHRFFMYPNVSVSYDHNAFNVCVKVFNAGNPAYVTYGTKLDIKSL